MILKKINVVIRADASLDIGTGHIMRCLTLASTLRNAGATCHFICREHQGNLIQQIRELGFTATGLSSNSESIAASENIYSRWLGNDWFSDAEETLAAINGSVDWLIVDHYAIDHNWETKLRSACHGVMVIDDLANKVHDCDILLDQNLGHNRKNYTQLVPAECKILAGPMYALIRTEFSDQRLLSLERRNEPALKHILITMGGVDKGNATGLVLSVLQDCSLPADCEITVVMGLHAPWLSDVQEFAKTMKRQTKVLINVENMAKLMTGSDLAIGAAGSTSWERCTLGLPSIVLVLAENQAAIANALQASGAAQIIHLRYLSKELKEFFSDPSLLQKLANLSSASYNLTDGLGTEMVKQALLSKELV